MDTDPGFDLLASLSKSLQSEYLDDDLEWSGSPFEWIKMRPSSRQKGAIAEKIVALWLESKGFHVTRSPDSEADRVVNDRRIEIKFSTLWKNGSYKFQQLRDQNYEYAICLGVSPKKAHCWIIPKSVILERWQRGDGIQSQHGGSKGSDTAWLSVEVDSPPSWLAEFGGSLEEAISVFKTQLEM